MKERLLKWGLSAVLLLSLANKFNSGILYSQKQLYQGVKLEQVVDKIKKKYPKKNLEYFSKGFLQFAKGEFVKDSEIEEMVKGLNPEKEKAVEDPNYVIDRVNFDADYAIMLDSNFYHLGDGTKKWYPVKKQAEGIFYEKKFEIKNLDEMTNSRLGIEVFSADSENKVYLNGELIGFTPRISKGNWESLMKKYKENCPFLYGEIFVSKYLRKGENTIKIESKKSGRIFKSYDDFLMGRVQIVYDKKEK